VPKNSQLAQFLRDRRARLSPSDVGLPCGARRRIAGLRREEVASLAGVSVEYYLRIEQGRETNPSDQVLNGLARALNLDDDTAAYLRDLVPRCGNRRARKDLNPAIDSLIDGWPLSPALVHDRALNVVSANPIARAVLPQLAPGTNTLRSLFLDPESTTVYRNWDTLTDQRNEMFVAIGVGDTFAAIRLALDVISRAHCSVEGRTAAQLHAWLNAYTCHDDALQLRHWIGRVTAAH